MIHKTLSCTDEHILHTMPQTEFYINEEGSALVAQPHPEVAT